MSLAPLDWAVLLLYFIGLTAMGLRFGKGQTSRDEYQLGGRRMHWLLAGGSLLATLLSTVSFVAVPGEMVRNGPALLTSLFALPFAVAVIGYVLIPAFKALPFRTAYEYLDHRFGGRARRLSAIVFLIHTVVWMGLIIYTCCLVVTTATGWGLTPTIVLIGLVTTVYASAGGFRAVVYSDNIQLVILLGGALLVPYVVFRSLGTGPLEWWGVMEQAGHADIVLASWDPTVRLTVLGAVTTRFFWMICTHGSDQVAVQRYLSTPSEQTARRTLLTAAVADVLLLSLLGLCGVALFALYQDRSGLAPQAFLGTVAASADRLLPKFIVEELPAGTSGLLLAALLAAAMSSLSSGVSAISSVLTDDLFGGRTRGSEGKSLRADRLAALAAGVAGIAVALAIAPAARETGWNLVDLMERLNHIFVGPLAVLFFAGMLFRRASLAGAFAGFACGLVCSALICMPGSWLGLEQDISFMWVVPVPFLVGLAVAFVSTRILAQPAPENV